MSWDDRLVVAKGKVVVVAVDADVLVDALVLAEAAMLSSSIGIGEVLGVRVAMGGGSGGSLEDNVDSGVGIGPNTTTL